MTILPPVILCIATGFMLVSLAWPRGNVLTSQLPLKASLCAGCGVGVFSFIYFLSLLLDLSKKGLVAMDLLVFGLLLLILLSRKRSSALSQVPPVQHAVRGSLGWVGLTAAVGFVVALLASLYASVRGLLVNPHGTGWDSFAIWNLRARFLFRGGQHWEDGFTGLLSWSHPDYPLLLPASIAHFWKYLGSDSPAVPAGIAFVFTWSAIALLFSLLNALRGSTQACLGGLVLLGTPFFMEHGLSEYADTPLSFFFLATLGLLCLHERIAGHDSSLLALAGVTTGFAAWTKNEGLLFLGAIVLARCVVLARRKSGTVWRQMTPFLAGLAPALLLVGYFKIRVAGPGDLFSAPHLILERILEPARYWLILKWFVREFLGFGDWALVPATIVGASYALLLGAKVEPEFDTSIPVSVLTLGLMMAGYFAIFIITPYDLKWHLRYSLNRLFAQLWPSAVLMFFLMVRTPEQAISDRGQ